MTTKQEILAYAVSMIMKAAYLKKGLLIRLNTFPALLLERRLVENILWTPLIKQLSKC